MAFTSLDAAICEQTTSTKHLWQFRLPIHTHAYLSYIVITSHPRLLVLTFFPTKPLFSTSIICSGFTMYTTCVIWLAFVPLYFGTANHVPLRITSMSVTISLSASVTVACLFSPKVIEKQLHIVNHMPLAANACVLYIFT